MNIYQWNNMDTNAKTSLLRRAEKDISEQMEVALGIINGVKKGGDEAVCRFTEKFDGAHLTPQSLRVTEEEIDEGYERIGDAFKETLWFAAKNIRTFHTRDRKSVV